MLDVCVTHFGTKYPTTYLDKLERGIARNYSSDFNFIVKTDCPNRHWDKISFFDCHRPTVIMDIDQLVVGELDTIFDARPRQLAGFRRWYKPGISLQGGFYKIIPSEENALVKEKFYQDPNFWITHYGIEVGTPWMGEQLFVQHSVKTIDWLPSEKFGVYADYVWHKDKFVYLYEFNDSYRRLTGESMVNPPCNFNKKLSLVHFIYNSNMIEEANFWIKEIWDGM